VRIVWEAAKPATELPPSPTGHRYRGTNYSGAVFGHDLPLSATWSNGGKWHWGGMKMEAVLVLMRGVQELDRLPVAPELLERMTPGVVIEADRGRFVVVDAGDESAKRAELVLVEDE
jgi:hypothetical protein